MKLFLIFVFFVCYFTIKTYFDLNISYSLKMQRIVNYIFFFLMYYKQEFPVLLTLKVPNKNCSRRHFNILLLSLKKIRLDFSCESSA